MGTDVLILNTAVADFRRDDFGFADALAGAGGLAKCRTEDMPAFSQEQLAQWSQQGCATAGGIGNTAPLIARTGLRVSAAANLGKGDYDGLDAQGWFFYDLMSSCGIDMSEMVVHPNLPTGTTFIHSSEDAERGGIAYFPNANNDFDFERFKGSVQRLQPKVLYYMYSGLSDRGDADGGRLLADFIGWARRLGAVTIVDSHTLTGQPQQLIATGRPVAEYRLLEPLLPELDIFFTSSDEARLIENTLRPGRDYGRFSQQENNVEFLRFLAERFWSGEQRTRLFGVTVSNGAYEIHSAGPGGRAAANRIDSRFMAGEVTDLVGAGDAFRAGLISYIASNIERFKDGSIDFAEAVQTGNLFASLYIRTSLPDRYRNIKTFDKMLEVVRSGDAYPSWEALAAALG